jgi:hypothetical protein
MGSAASAPSEWYNAAVRQDLGKLKRMLAQSPHYINAQDRERLQSALHVACRGGYADVVVFLLHNGASTDVRDEESKTPLQHAEEQKRDLVVKILQDWEASGRTAWRLQGKDAADWLRMHELEAVVGWWWCVPWRS